jgi:5-oxoprolinase (ATP-hydrolysing)
MKEIDTLTNIEYMDDGTPIELKLTIDRRERKAVFDFTGTGLEVLGNTNAPRSITRSAILYCLRSLIGKDIPLNSGCLIPLTIIIPEHTILSPSKSAAVVGGNV